MHLDGFECIWTRSEKFEKFGKIGRKIKFFAIFVRFLRSYAKTDVTSNFLAIFCSRSTYLELGTTLGAHLGIGYRPGMASASPLGVYPVWG